MLRGAAHNPFSVSRLGPHGMRYQFSGGMTLDGILEELHLRNWRAEFVGPKGAGKSTLVHTVRAACEERGWRTTLFRTGTDSPRLPWNWRLQISGSRVVFLDGGESVSMRTLHSLARRCQAGLIVTTHRPLGLAEPVRVFPTEEAMEQIVDSLLNDEKDRWRDKARELLHQHNGNAREALHALYCLYEDDV